MPFEPDPDNVGRIFWIGSALFLLLAIVSAVGEVLGWWDLVGELGITISTLASLLLAALGLLWSATREQASGIETAVLANGRRLVSVDGKLDKLDVIEGAIAGEDGMVGQLDAVQFELDRQTGVLGEQLSVLSQIRDGMA